MIGKTVVFVILLSVILVGRGQALAGQDLIESVATGCKVELETWCQDVTPGESRVLACLYARSDKLSGSCEYALYDAAVQLQRAVAALAYLVNECADDLEQLCAEVEAGEGRLIGCLDKNADKVSARCKDAVATVAVKQ